MKPSGGYDPDEERGCCRVKSAATSSFHLLQAQTSARAARRRSRGVRRGCTPWLCSQRTVSRTVRRRPLYTAYSIDTLQSNDRFSHDKATAELGFFPRDIARTVADTVLWLRRRRARA